MTLLAPNPALPYRIGDVHIHVPIRVQLLRQREARQEQIIDQQIDQLLSQRPADFRILVYITKLLCRIQTIKQWPSAPIFSIPRPCWLARLPEELLFPCGQMVGLVDVRQQACQYADAVQRFWCSRAIRIRVHGFALKGIQPCDDGVYEGLDVPLRIDLGGARRPFAFGWAR